MYECFAYMYACITHEHLISTPGEQQRASVPLKLELQVAMGHHIRTEN